MTRPTSSRIKPTVTVAGLGPGRSGAITEETRELMSRPGPRFLRTRRHPTADEVENARSFDDLYEQADSFDEVYSAIVDSVAAAALDHGQATYLVPGSPIVLEHSVQALRCRPDLEVHLLPAVSFLDEVWTRLGVDPIDEGVRLIDGHRFATEAADQRGPLLVAHVHARWVLSDIKLAVDADDDQKVIVLQRLGTDEEQVIEVGWNDLDRAVEADHLTSLYIPELRHPVGAELVGSVELMARLRADCPWDRTQDHRSLRRYLMEEAYEVLDAVNLVVEARSHDPADDGGTDEARAYEELEGELGDLWFQILFHSQLAAERGQFTVADVARTLTEKMVNRHPHVFAPDRSTVPVAADRSDREPQGAAAAGSMLREEVWEERKQVETGRSSAFDGIPAALPGLSLTDKVLSRATKALGRPAHADPIVADMEHALRSMRTDGESGGAEAAVGRLIVATVWLAREVGVDAELAVRDAVLAMADELRGLEHSARSDGAWVVG